MYTILCNFNLFDAKQIIYAVDQEGQLEIVGYADLDSLSEILMSACIQYSANKIYLHGNKEYLGKISKDIKEFEKMTYGENTIEIEVY